MYGCTVVLRAQLSRRASLDSRSWMFPPGFIWECVLEGLFFFILRFITNLLIWFLHSRAIFPWNLKVFFCRMWDSRCRWTLIFQQFLLSSCWASTRGTSTWESKLHIEYSSQRVWSCWENQHCWHLRISGWCSVRRRFGKKAADELWWE